jgi:hypothetical protein
MLDQLFNIVKESGQDTVVNNPDVPNEYNQEVMADATQTIAGGLKNIMAGGGFENILDLFKGGGSGNGISGGGVSGLLKNPIVSMMVGYFISKLVKKYSMSPSVATNVANNLIPHALNGLIQQTNDPNNPNINLDGLIGSLTGSAGESQQTGETPLQNLLDSLTGHGVGNNNAGSSGGSGLLDIIGNLTQKTQDSFQDGQQSGGGGLMDLIKGFISK